MANYWIQHVFVEEMEAETDEEAKNRMDEKAKDSPLTNYARDHGFKLYKSVLTKDDPIVQEEIIEGAKARLAMYSSRFS